MAKQIVEVIHKCNECGHCDSGINSDGKTKSIIAWCDKAELGLPADKQPFVDGMQIPFDIPAWCPLDDHKDECNIIITG